MSSKLRAPVKRERRPHSVPPPNDVPPTRSNWRGPDTFIIETPLPILTRRYGFF